MVCLLLGTVWLDRGNRWALVASLSFGLLGLSIREFAIAAPAAVLFLSWARSPTQEKLWLAITSGLFFSGVLSVLWAAAAIPGRSAPESDIVGLIRTGSVFVTFAAALLPAVALHIGRRLATIRPETLIVGAGVACFAVVVPWASQAGNSWTQTGLGSNLLLSGIRAPVLSAAAWALSAQVALFAAILVAALGVRWGRQNLARTGSGLRAVSVMTRIARGPDGLFLGFLLAYAAELVLFAPFFVYDRYLYPMVPVAAILLLRGPARPFRLGRSYAFAHAALVWLAISAFLIAANSFAYDAARYREGEATVRMGYDPGTVDAGYEWVGYHASLDGSLYVPATDMIWSVDRWTLRDPCAVLSNSPLNDETLTLIRIKQSAYLQYLFFGPAEPLYLYGALSAHCPPLPRPSGAV